MRELVLDRAAGRALKKEGMQAALLNSGAWGDDILAEFERWLRLWKGKGAKTITIEAFRTQCKVQPLTHQSWGSLPGMAVAAGLIAPDMLTEDQQRRVKAASPRTRAHDVKVWRITV